MPRAQFFTTKGKKLHTLYLINYVMTLFITGYLVITFKSLLPLVIVVELVPWIFIFRYSGDYVIVSEKGLKYNDAKIPLLEIEGVKVMSGKDGTGDIKIVWKEGCILFHCHKNLFIVIY
ncbi:hypothetical protein [Sulfolobus acidocaldarius]|uniref:Uncharacterized protein n=3 Tax=Sulfolobus acidocaldarius TaxID=2285 RepID=A0A0U3GNJ3_9CREN|nr:hypothetical protein [Sulfolobus acidocaldarius]AGE71958.1 hypothetical protein SacN8_10040 [Sulfolobus acidocaldarius N8]AGE74230.1 hypothetical protein SacRon12I_10060 [Sulfolobus acidocaldarius Ron12/I]ALU29880.1 hypothetical protein ATY89_07970 [Sulfolobus acidocaldarius]ALU32620.1 hypothetical protein ATZ20_10990 [Sulfolobus acidocaldarius]WCM35820.1 hypothetical protein GO597_11015 [Sulfolobus acidocaldarius DSM 639]